MIAFLWIVLLCAMCDALKRAPYKIVESLDRGKIVVAAKSLLPGELVMEEKEPLLYYTFPPELSIKLRDRALSCFTVFMQKLSPAQEEKVLNLYGPTNGTVAEGLRGVASNMIKYIESDMSRPANFSQDEIDTFVKVASVMRLNEFCLGEGQFGIYDDLSRFAHSCDANCVYTPNGRACICRAIKPIAAGEELTISYVGDRDLLPIHLRRHKYLNHKEFTCHCPRCDAPGDDTRQFHCFDPACKGVMMVLQSINKEEVNESKLTYTGVEYVEPHLLPCTECHRAAPIDYQTKMFDLESRLPELSERFKATLDSYMKDRFVDGYDSLLTQINSLGLPRRHAGTIPILLTKLMLLCVMHLHHGERVVPQYRQAVMDFVAVHIAVFPAFHPLKADAIHSACALATNNAVSPLSLEEQKSLWQQALRMHLLSHGRERRLQKADNALPQVLEKLPLLQSTEVCAFCEESPQRAAFVLSRCGKCKKVCYCSAGCQMAHWKLHKNTCK